MHFLRLNLPDIGLEDWLSMYVGFVPTPLLGAFTVAADAAVVAAAAAD